MLLIRSCMLINIILIRLSWIKNINLQLKIYSDKREDLCCHGYRIFIVTRLNKAVR